MPAQLQLAPIVVHDANLPGGRRCFSGAKAVDAGTPRQVHRQTGQARRHRPTRTPRTADGRTAAARPIRLTGHRTRLDAATGEILDHFDSGRRPAGELLVRCGNRRATRRPACSTVYRYDTYQLIAAGLRGGKTVPASVATHPRVFATLTAPRLRPRPQPARHRPLPLRPDPPGRRPAPWHPNRPDRYDYAGAVLWNAHAPALRAPSARP
jgi:hypothetical protein